MPFAPTGEAERFALTNSSVSESSRLALPPAFFIAIVVSHFDRDAHVQAERYFERVQTPHKLGRLILAPTGRAGDFDSHGVDCAFVFRAPDGVASSPFRMTYVGFDGVGYRTGTASSDDLITWRRDGLLIDRGLVGSITEFNVALTWILRDNDLFGNGSLRRVGGEYIGTYHAYPQPGYESGPAAIGICKSDDLCTWRLDDPVIRAEDGTEWERGGLYKSCLVEHAGMYYLFYNAKDRGKNWREQIGFATSRDLKTWTRHPRNPVVRVGVSGSIDNRFVSEPCVLRVDDVWAMFTFSLSSDGFARDTVAFSDDLVTWTKATRPLVDVGPRGSIDERYAHKPSMFTDNGVLYHFYTAVAPNPSGRLGEVNTHEMRGISVAASRPL